MRRPSPRVVFGTIFEDVGDWAGEKLEDPVTYLRLIPFMGWVGTLVEYLGTGWGLLAKGAEVATHLAPGLIAGESVSEAFMSDYGARLKLAAAVMTGGYLAAASGAAAGALSGLAAALSQAGVNVSAGAVASAGVVFAYQAVERWLEKGVEAAAREIGPDRTKQILDQAQRIIDEQFNGAFARLMRDARFSALFNKVTIAAQKAKGRTTAEALRELGLSPAAIANKLGDPNLRQDVIALATNAVLHERVYDVSSRTFDLMSGQQFLRVEADRTGGTNAAWALIDLLDGQNANLLPVQIASLTADYERAKRVEEAAPPYLGLDSTEVLTELLLAQNRGASPEIVRAYVDKFHAAMGHAPVDKVIEAKIAAGEIGSPRRNTLLTLAVLTAPFWGTVLFTSSWGRSVRNRLRLA